MHEAQWLKSLIQPVLVVGNGVLQRPVPESEYGSVVRINNYVLGGLSGERATHWVANGYQDIEPRPVTPVLIPWSAKAQALRGNPGTLFFIHSPTAFYVSDDRHLKWWFPSCVINGKRFPSTGFCLLALLIMHRVTPDIIGFDGMRTGHQDNPTWKHGHVNSVKVREWAIVQQWHLRMR